MAALGSQPLTKSLLQPNKFQLIFSRIPNTVFFCQSATLPSVSMDPAIFNTPFENIPIIGNKITFNPFSVKVLCDRDLRSWIDIFTWFRGMGRIKSFVDYQQMIAQYGSPYSDATLVLNTNLNNPNIKFQFKNCFPTDLGEIIVDTTQSADEQVYFNVSFRYEYFEPERILESNP